MRELLSRYFTVVRTVAGRYGGVVEKFIGDAVMAVWGTPAAAEGDAERAVRVLAGMGGAQRVDGLEAPLTGRDAELRTIKELFHAAAERRVPRLVLVSGPAGVGKSRLGWEFEKYLDGLAEQVRWHRGRCLPYGDGVAFWALAEMVRQRLGTAEEDPAEVAAGKLAAGLDRFVPDPAERAYVGARLGRLLGVAFTGDSGAPLGREELFAGWRLFFERLAAEGPVVLVVEDAQYADAGLLDFLDYLVDWVRDLPVYVLVFARPELGQARPGFGAGRNRTALTLDPLDAASMDALVEALVPGMPGPARANVTAQAQGIPLFAAVAQSRQSGARRGLVLAVTNLAQALLMTGDWDAAEAELDMAADGDDLTDIEFLACYRAWVAALRGDTPRAEAILAGLGDLRASEDPQDQANIAVAEAFTAAARAQPAAALRAAQAALGYAGALGISHEYPRWAWPLAARAAHDLADTAAAAELLARLDRYRPGLLAPMQRAERALVRARLAATGDGPAAADAAAFAVAVGGLREHSTPYHLAHGLLDHAAHLLGMDDNEAVAAAIGEARDIAERLRCQPLLDRAAEVPATEPRIRAQKVTAPASEESASARGG